MRRINNVINGRSVEPSGVALDLVNPVTGEVFAAAPVSTRADVDSAFEAAAAAFKTWSNTTPSQRQQALLKVTDVLDANAEDIVAIECENTGKPTTVMMSEEITPMIDQIRFFAGACRVVLMNPQINGGQGRVPSRSLGGAKGDGSRPLSGSRWLLSNPGSRHANAWSRPVPHWSGRCAGPDRSGPAQPTGAATQRQMFSFGANAWQAAYSDGYWSSRSGTIRTERSC